MISHKRNAKQYYFTPTTMSVIKISQQSITSVDENVEKLEASSTDENVKQCGYLGKV